jgi:hypothetical protein
MLTRRSMLVVLGAAPLVLSSPARAQSRPSAAQLQRLIEQALKDPETVTFARPQPLGFTERVVTHQLSYQRGGVNYTLAVTNPRLRDGLIFFSHQPARQLFIMHRTDTHLNRVASARNDLQQGDAGLTRWDGPSADNDFSAQLAFWATIN